jgi:predicted NBD/HSP70 family sugar kinase
MTSRTNREDPVALTRGRPLGDVVLEMIWRRREITRAEIARTTGLARSTVSEIVNTLLQTGLVREWGDGPSQGGRRPILLRFEDSARTILGVDMGASHVAVMLTDLRGRILGWVERSFPVRRDPDGTCALIAELCGGLLDARPGSREILLGLGVAVPAPVDQDTPEELSPVVLPEWRGHRGLAVVAREFGVPLAVDNDANLGALAELWWGAGVGLEDFTFVKVATGVGAGHILRGEIYRGAAGVAGEIGHVSIDPAGPECICGNRGCLTTFVGTSALLDRVRQLAMGYPDSPLSQGDPDLDGLVEATLEGDFLARRVVREAASHLGTAIAGLLNLMNPGAVILGGSLMRVGDHLLEPLREAVASRTLTTSVLGSRIGTSELGDRNVALGAATLVLARALASPELFQRSPP